MMGMGMTNHESDRGPVRVLLVDDHVILRDGLEALIAAQADFEIVGATSTAAGAARLAAERRPDVVVLDLRLPDRNGIHVARELLQRGATPRVLILTAHGTPQHVRAARRVGVSGFLPKETAGADLLEALRVVAHGGTAFDPSLDPTAHTGSPPYVTGILVEPLSERELDVLRLVANGARNAKIGERLGITERTVEGHVSAVLGKLGVDSRMEAVAEAGRLGLISL